MPRTHPIPIRPLPVYRIDDVGMESGPDVSSADQDMLGSLMRYLLPTPAVLSRRATPISSEREQLIQRLMGKEHPVWLLLRERSGFTDIEILLRVCFRSDLRRRSIHRRRWFAMGRRLCVFRVMCHAASRCPTLDDTFPFLPPGRQADWVGDGFVMRSPQKVADRHQAETSSDPGRGVNHPD